jgi:hypothetical protein
MSKESYNEIMSSFFYTQNAHEPAERGAKIDSGNVDSRRLPGLPCSRDAAPRQAKIIIGIL